MSRTPPAQPNPHGDPTQPAPISSKRRRGAPRGNANARRHGLYSAADPDAQGFCNPCDEPTADAPALLRAEHNLRRLQDYQDTLDPASEWERFQVAQGHIIRLLNTVHRLRAAPQAERRAQRKLALAEQAAARQVAQDQRRLALQEQAAARQAAQDQEKATLARRKLALQEQAAALDARKVAVAEQRLALAISLARAAARRHLQASVERDMRQARKGIPPTPPRNAAEWQRFERTYAAAHPERSAAQSQDAAAQWIAEENANIEKQFPFPARPQAAPTPPAHDAPAATRHASPLHPSPAAKRPLQSFTPGAEKNENMEEQIARPAASAADAPAHHLPDEADDLPDDPDEPIVGDADAVYGFEAHVARVTAQVHAAQAYWRQVQEQAASPRGSGATNPPVPVK